jgi:hypothetical protein
MEFQSPNIGDFCDLECSNLLKNKQLIGASSSKELACRHF